MSFGPKDELVVTGSTDKRVRVWRADDMKVIATLLGHGATVYASAVHPSGELAATGDAKGRMILWDVPTGKALHTIETGERVEGLAFVDEGRVLVSAGEGVRAWDTRTGEPHAKIRWDGGTAKELSLHPDGRTLAWSASKGTAHVWDLERNELVRSVAIPGKSDLTLYPVSLHPEQPWLAAGASDGRILVWDLESGELIESVLAHRTRLYSLAFSPNGEVLASGSDDRELKLYRVATPGG